MLRVSQNLLRFLRALNIFAGVAFAILFLLSFAFEAEALSRIRIDVESGHPDAVIAALRIVLMIGVGAGAAAHVLFGRLLAIVGTVAAGDPFVEANARRLQTIAWALLALQVLDLAFGLADWRVMQLTSETLGWSPSLTGWLAVVMAFVLARVFAAGAAMRDEIAATV